MFELFDRIVVTTDTNDIPSYVSLDFSKAVESILFNKLAYYGLNDTTLQLFKSDLQNKKQ